MLAGDMDHGTEAMDAIVDQLLELTLRAGGAEAEVYGSVIRETSLRGHEADVDWLRSAVTRGMGVRVISDGLTGYAYSSDLTDEGLAFMAERAVANAHYGVADSQAGLPRPGELALPALPDLVDADLARISPGNKRDFLQVMVAAAKDRVPGISVPRVQYGDEHRTVYVSNSQGIRASYSRTFAYGWLETVAIGENDKQTSHSFTVARGPGGLDCTGAGIEAAEGARSYLGARPITPSTTTLVLSPLAAATFLFRISALFTGSALLRRTTPFVGGEGQVIGSPNLTILDDPLHSHGVASRPFDDEGVPSRTLAVVEQGRLVNMLHNTTSARRSGAASTGHARRSSYRSLPGIAPSNFLIQPGQATPAELIAGVQDGIYVRDLSGWEATSPHSGEFSAFIYGQRIENGQLTIPVSKTAMVGRVQDLLHRLTAVGSDLRWVPIDCVVGAPTLLFESVQIS